MPEMKTCAVHLCPEYLLSTCHFAFFSALVWCRPYVVPMQASNEEKMGMVKAESEQADALVDQKNQAVVMLQVECQQLKQQIARCIW